MEPINLPNYKAAKNYFISPEGLQKSLHLPRDNKYPARNFIWTDDFKT